MHVHIYFRYSSEMINRCEFRCLLLFIVVRPFFFEMQTSMYEKYEHRNFLSSHVMSIIPKQNGTQLLPHLPRS